MGCGHRYCGASRWLTLSALRKRCAGLHPAFRGRGSMSVTVERSLSVWATEWAHVSEEREASCDHGKRDPNQHPALSQSLDQTTQHN